MANYSWNNLYNSTNFGNNQESSEFSYTSNFNVDFDTGEPFDQPQGYEDFESPRQLGIADRFAPPFSWDSSSDCLGSTSIPPWQTYIPDQAQSNTEGGYFSFHARCFCKADSSAGPRSLSAANVTRSQAAWGSAALPDARSNLCRNSQQSASRTAVIDAGQGQYSSQTSGRSHGDNRIALLYPTEERGSVRPSRIIRELGQCYCPDNNCTYQKPDGQWKYKTFTRHADLERHMQTVHGEGKETLRCPACQYYTKRKDKMREHDQRWHSSGHNAYQSSR